MQIEIIFFLLLGVVTGTIAGFLPGIGIFASLMILYPFLNELSAVNLLVYYVALASTTQYMGNISSTVFAVPGEASSLPAVKEGHPMFLRGQGHLAISGCAIGSFFGSMVVLCITFLSIGFLQEIYKFYGTYAQAVTLTAVVVLVCVFSGSLLLSTLTAVLGYTLGAVGCNPNSHVCFATFNNADLTTGLPLISVMCAIYVVPALLKGQEFSTNSTTINLTGYKNQFNCWFSAIGSSLRGTVIGFIAGFTPGVGTATSSNLAYTIEKWLEEKKGRYQIGNYRSLVSAETANNAGAFTSLLPLFVLGIPLVPSEAVLYDLMVSKGVALGQTFDLSIFYIVAVTLIITNFVALVIAWPLSNYVTKIHKLNVKYLNLIVIVILTATIFYSGLQNFQEWYYLTVFICLLPVGYFLRNINTLPLIFLFLLQDRIDSVLPRTAELINYAFN
jgi:putative tricarboxylic transport membrane protein